MADGKRCPACGDMMRDGRCTFCGYVATEYDEAAREKWAGQKEALESNGGAAASRPGILDALRGIAGKAHGDPDARKQKSALEGPRRDPDEEPRTNKEPAAMPHASGTARKGAAAVPKRQSPVRKRPVPSGKAPRGRPGFFKRLFFNAIAVLWFLAYALAIGRKLADDWRAKEQAGQYAEIGGEPQEGRE